MKILGVHPVTGNVGKLTCYGIKNADHMQQWVIDYRTNERVSICPALVMGTLNRNPQKKSVHIVHHPFNDKWLMFTLDSNELTPFGAALHTCTSGKYTFQDYMALQKTYKGLLANTYEEAMAMSTRVLTSIAIETVLAEKYNKFEISIQREEMANVFETYTLGDFKFQGGGRLVISPDNRPRTALDGGDLGPHITDEGIRLVGHDEEKREFVITFDWAFVYSRTEEIDTRGLKEFILRRRISQSLDRGIAFIKATGRALRSPHQQTPVYIVNSDIIDGTGVVINSDAVFFVTDDPLQAIGHIHPYLHLITLKILVNGMLICDGSVNTKTEVEVARLVNATLLGTRNSEGFNAPEVIVTAANAAIKDLTTIEE